MGSNVPEEWMALLGREPEWAMEMLMKRYYDMVYHVAGRYLRNPEDVKECVNDVFAEIYFHRASFNPSRGNLTRWIWAIARHHAISVYRRTTRDTMLHVMKHAEASDVMISGAGRMTAAEIALDLENAIARLDEVNQRIIRMKYYGGLSLQEIAQLLQLPYETVKKRHTRSLKKLRGILVFFLVLMILSGCYVPPFYGRGGSQLLPPNCSAAV